ncbi:unnamed protein product [Echinostoma caproni]|uniref:SMB domain-containing protein n=1 Tax=Echinostoma caproni TaxID=27848 RepID=A0A183A8R6_9TREM|nr:unnamed protein product [Echinostoma caproni]
MTVLGYVVLPDLTCASRPVVHSSNNLNEPKARDCGRSSGIRQRQSQLRGSRLFNSFSRTMPSSSSSSSSALSSSIISPPPGTLSVSSSWFPFLAFLLVLSLSELFLPLAEAGCRTSAGLAMCCRGRQSTCSSVTLDYSSSNTTRVRRHLSTIPQKRCFCDEHCTLTNDCCPDYREVCQKPGEVAQLLPVRGDVMQMLRQHDMRWDVRRKLYLGRLIQQNRTEQPEPEPYCTIYEITHANPACQAHNLLWQYANGYMPYSSDPYSYYRIRRHRSWGSRPAPILQSKRLMSDWGMTNTWSHVWMTHAALLSPGQQICVTCYPAYIRCPAVGYLGMETRWRALRTADCQGTFRLVSKPQQSCTCGQGVPSFVFV